MVSNMKSILIAVAISFVSTFAMAQNPTIQFVDNSVSPAAIITRAMTDQEYTAYQQSIIPVVVPQSVKDQTPLTRLQMFGIFQGCQSAGTSLQVLACVNTAVGTLRSQ